MAGLGPATHVYPRRSSRNVMPGLGPGTHASPTSEQHQRSKSWMAGPSPAMTTGQAPQSEVAPAEIHLADVRIHTTTTIRVARDYQKTSSAQEQFEELTLDSTPCRKGRGSIRQ